jgi:hypothetical protein
MIFSRKQNCPNCGAENPTDASFCKSCAKPLGSGTIKCGACGTINPGDALYCMNCSQELESSQTARIVSNRWVITDNDFAVRVDTEDLPGLLKKGILVEPGTNGMLIEDGANVGVVPPGSYLLDSFSQRFGDLFRSGLPKRITALLVQITPTDLDFPIKGLFSKDPLPVNMTVKLQVEVQEPAKFLINMLRGRERLTNNGLKEHLFPEIEAVASQWVRSHTVEELAEDFSLRPKFELALEEALRRSFAQAGLRFLQVRALQMNLEVIDRVNNKKGEYALQIAEQDAELEGRKSLLSVRTGLDLVGLAEETARIELEEKKINLYQRMRDAVNSDKMNEVKSETDLRSFLREIDRAEILDKKEYEELLRTWKEESEDHDRARAFLLAKLDTEQKYQSDLLDLTVQQNLKREARKFDDEEYEAELSTLRKKRDFEFEQMRQIVLAEIENKRELERFELEKTKLQVERDQLLHETQSNKMLKDADLAEHILRNLKALERLDAEENFRIARENEIALMKAKLEDDLSRFEMEERARASEREHELKRLEKIGTFTAEQLIVVSPVEQAKILADLKQTEALQHMSEEQILALAADKNPQVISALTERYKAIAEGNASQKEKEMYERLLGEQKEWLDKMDELTEKRVGDLNRANERALESSKHALDTLADTAKSFANIRTSPSVVIGDHDNVTHPGYRSGRAQSGPPLPLDEEVKTCPKCGRQVEVSARHCPYCGNKFIDIA